MNDAVIVGAYKCFSISIYELSKNAFVVKKKSAVWNHKAGSTHIDFMGNKSELSVLTIINKKQFPWFRCLAEYCITTATAKQHTSKLIRQ